MRKIKLFLIFVLIIFVGIFAYKLNLYMKKTLNRQVLNQEIKKENLEEIKKQIDATAIIKKELKTINIIGVLEGTEEYKQLIEYESWYAYRGINIDWHYRFSIAMNCNDIYVESSNGEISITIDNNKLFIWFIEKTEDSTSRSEASWLAKKYSSQEIESLEFAVRGKIEDKIKLTPEYWRQAQKSLEVNLTKICNDLGFNNIKFKYLRDSKSVE